MRRQCPESFDLTLQHLDIDVGELGMRWAWWLERVVTVSVGCMYVALGCRN